jgi:Xaa-Pro aminopeptidase
MNEIVRAKLSQAVQLLQEYDLPLWIVQFARETHENPQPVQHLAVGTTITWPAAFIVTATGESIAIVGTGDVANVEGVGAYGDVRGYVQDIGPVLRECIAHAAPERIGVSFSRNDDSADNITHGMYVILHDLLSETPYAGRLVPADAVLGALRARKLPVEIARIQYAAEATLDLFTQIESSLRLGITEREIAQSVHNAVASRGWGLAWDRGYDPTVHIGARSAFGHVGPSETALQHGDLVHVDLGVKIEGYCSDLQRTWYVPTPDEAEAPESVTRPFRVLLRSLEAGFDALRPGVAGWTVDDVARRVLTDAGYDHPAFSLGHQLGQSTHDGGTLLGPRWSRYGDRPLGRVEEGHIYTLEFGLPTSAGWLGVEEDVLVTANGGEYLVPPQRELRCVRL